MPPPLWTPDEDAALREIIAADLSPSLRTAQYAARLPCRSLNAIHNRTNLLGINKVIRKARPWTDDERDILRRDWLTVSTAAIADNLNRPKGSVTNEAAKLGLFRKQKYAKIQATSAMDAVIQSAYASNQRGMCKAAAKKLGVTIGWVKYRAQSLGLQRQGYNAPWTPEEDVIVERYHEKGGAGYVSRRLKAAGYIRSVLAVNSRIYNLGLSWKNRDVYNADSLGQAMGVDGKSIVRWIQRGYLKARKENCSGVQANDEARLWLIEHKNVRQFLIEHVSHYRLGAVDRFWFVSAIAGDKEATKIQQHCGIGGDGGFDEMRVAS